MALYNSTITAAHTVQCLQLLYAYGGLAGSKRVAGRGRVAGNKRVAGRGRVAGSKRFAGSRRVAGRPALHCAPVGLCD